MTPTEKAMGASLVAGDEPLPEGRAGRGQGECSSALLGLALRAADEGAYERVSQLFATARTAEMQPQHARRWRRLLIEAGDFSVSAELDRLLGEAANTPSEQNAEPVAAQGDTASEQSPDPAARCREEESADDVLDFDSGCPEAPQPAVADGVVASMLRWFAGRGDVYARQWYDARRDRCGYWPVRQPLARGVIELHLLGRVTLGQYVLHPDDTVGFAALDFDPTAAALEQVRLTNEAEGPLALAPLADYVRHVMRTAEAAGLCTMAEDTGGAGLHVWLFFTPRLPAEKARALLRELLWRSGPQPPSVAVEVFPKQDRLSGKGLGNLIKLPLGVHQVTLRPSRFLDSELLPMAEADALARIQACDPAAIEKVLGSRVIHLPTTAAEGREPVSTPKPQPAPGAPSGPSPRALAEALAAISPGHLAGHAADRILAGCAVVRELARRAHEERALSPDAARALLYTVGLVGRDNERIDALFANAGVSRKELERVRRGLQSPMGCKKLGEHFPGLCDCCSAPVPPPEGYATPALLALREAPPARRETPSWSVPADVGADPGDVSIVEMQQRLARLEGALEGLLRELRQT